MAPPGRAQLTTGHHIVAWLCCTTGIRLKAWLCRTSRRRMIALRPGPALRICFVQCAKRLRLACGATQPKCSAHASPQCYCVSNARRCPWEALGKKMISVPSCSRTNRQDPVTRVQQTCTAHTLSALCTSPPHASASSYIRIVIQYLTVQ
jgi:hypothetical protein